MNINKIILDLYYIGFYKLCIGLNRCTNPRNERMDYIYQSLKNPQLELYSQNYD